MSNVIWFLQVLSLRIKTIFCWNCIDAAAPVQMQDFVLWWFVILRISFQEACPCHLRIIFLDHFHDSGLNATAKCLILLYLKCSISFAGYYFPLQPGILPYLKSQSLIMHSLFFFSSHFCEFSYFFHLCVFLFSVCLWHVRGQFYNTLKAILAPAEGWQHFFAGMDGHFFLSRSQATKSTEK